MRFGRGYVCSEKGVIHDVEFVFDGDKLTAHCVRVYREADEHSERLSKSLPAPVGEKVSLVCTRNNGHLVSREGFMKMLRSTDLNMFATLDKNLQTNMTSQTACRHSRKKH